MNKVLTLLLCVFLSFGMAACNACDSTNGSSVDSSKDSDAVEDNYDWLDELSN